MPKTKVIFIGNPLGGDDGVGPYLYNELNEDKELKDCTLIELGVIGLDLVSYVEDDDKLIIVDAIKSEKEPGSVVLLGEEHLTSDLKLVSQHDFGVEQTAQILRMFKPNLKKIVLIGINVSHIQPFSDRLSEELLKKIPKIKKEVKKLIIQISKSD